MNRDRFEKMLLLLREKGLDAAFLAPGSDLFYVTGLDFRSDSRLKGAFVTREGEAFFLCPSLHRDDVDAVRGAMRIVEWEDREGFGRPLGTTLREIGLQGRISVAFTRGIEAGDMIDVLAAAQDSGLEIDAVNGFTLLAPLRSVKSEEEQTWMRRASAMNDAMMEAFAAYLEPGIYEHDLMRFIVNFHESHGGKPRVPCVATGSNSSKPHYGRDNDRAVGDRDIVMVDCGGWYGGYSHDMTRTFFVGAPPDEQKNVYEIVLRAQLAAEEKVCAGAVPRDIDSAARDIIAAAGYGDFFPHRLGHGIGLDGHESPYISQANSVPLVEGNCFSIEPGIYLKGRFGVRIEDLVMLTESGTEILNRFPKHLMVV
jgi:Xaa-Pro dipeptidase